MPTSTLRLIAALVLGTLLGGCAQPVVDLSPSPTSRSATTQASPRPLPAPSATSSPRPATFELAATPTADWDDLGLQAKALRSTFVDDLVGLDQATRYWIDLTVEFDPAQPVAVLRGTARIRFVNPLQKPLEELVLYAWPNDRQYRSSMQLGTGLIDGRPVAGEPALDAIAWRFVLPEPLSAGGALDLSLPFEVRAEGPIGGSIPRRFGISQGVLFAPTFYPLVARLLDGAWEVRQAPAGGDTTNSEIAFFQVRLRAPAELALAATGVEVAREESGDQQVVELVSGPTRDFAFALGPLLTDARQVGGVSVRAWALPEHEQDMRSMLEAAAQQMQILSDLVGPYPYLELDLVDVPGAYGGIEYPGLVSVGTLGTSQIIGPTVHEVAHQWFYGLVGDDQLEEPWLDEAVATYSEALYYEHTQGVGRATGILSGFRDLLRTHPNPEQPIGLPVASYGSIDDYGLFVYLKGALFLDALRAELGDETFFEFLRAYYLTYRYRTASGEAFQALAEQTCACELDRLFDLWVWQGGDIPGL